MSTTKLYDAETRSDSRFRLTVETFRTPTDELLCNCQHRRSKGWPCCLCQVVCGERDTRKVSHSVDLECVQGVTYEDVRMTRPYSYRDNPAAYYIYVTEAITELVSDFFSNLGLASAAQVARYTVEKVVRRANTKLSKYAFHRIQIHILPSNVEESVGSCYVP